jgi:heme exporter protein D
MTSAVAAYLAMGGYAVYVWPAYALTAAVLGGLSLYSWWRYRDSRKSLDRIEQRTTARR